MSVADSPNSLIRSLGPAIKISEQVSKYSLSSCAWGALASAWCSIVGPERLRTHRHAKQLKEASGLYRQLYQIPSSNFDRIGRTRLKEVMQKSTAIIDQLEREGIVDDKIDWVKLTDPDLYISRLAKETAFAIKLLVRTKLENDKNSRGEFFDALAEHSTNALAFAYCAGENGHEQDFYVFLKRQSVALTDRYAGKVGVTVPRFKLEHIEQQAKNFGVETPVAELEVHDLKFWTIDSIRSNAWVICCFTVIASLGLTACGLFFFSKLACVVAMVFIGVAVAVSTQLYAMYIAKSWLDRFVFTVCGALFFLESLYLVFCGIGAITL